MQTVVLKCHNFGFQADTELLGASAAASNRKRSSSSVPNDVPSPAQGSQLEEDCSSSLPGLEFYLTSLGGCSTTRFGLEAKFRAYDYLLGEDSGGC